MGAIRGILLVFVSVFLFLSLLIGNLFLTLNLSLDYDNVKVEFGKIIEDVFEENNLNEIIEKDIRIMEVYCQLNSEYSFKDDVSGYNFIIPCDIVDEGPIGIKNYMLNDFVEKTYYKDYDCNFLDCLKKTGSPFFLISKQAKNYWENKFYFTLLISLGLIAFSFFLVDKKSNLFIMSGGLLIVAGLFFIKLDWVLSFFSEKYFLELLGIFFSDSYTVFVISLVIGIILIGIGFLLKLFKIGFKVSEIFSKLFKKKEIFKVKDEIKKEEPKKEPEVKRKFWDKLKILNIFKKEDKDKKSK
jgi:hypothetical protein